MLASLFVRLRQTFGFSLAALALATCAAAQEAEETWIGDSEGVEQANATSSIEWVTDAGASGGGPAYYEPSGGYEQFPCDCPECMGASAGTGYGAGDSPFRIRGWINGGFIGNMGNPASKFNGPYNAVDRSNEAMGNQAYLIAERNLPCDGFDGWGGRIDVLYGEDYILAQSLGVEARPNGTAHWNPEYYGLAIPQAYVQYGNNELSIKAGHFYTIVGYEGVQAPTNFFYSKSYSYQFGGPFTHWGTLLSWKLFGGWELEVGLTNGWNALDRPSDRLGEIAALKYSDDYMWTSVSVVTGDEFNNPAELPGIAPDMANRTRYSWLVGLRPADRWEYVFHQWLGSQSNGTIDGDSALWYGVDQYLYYQHNCRWRSGLRFEWFRDQDGTRVGLNRPSNPNKAPFPGSFYSLTYGLNWMPTERFIFRPEIRADWFDGGPRRPYDDGSEDYQLMVGFDLIYLF